MAAGCWGLDGVNGRVCSPRWCCGFRLVLLFCCSAWRGHPHSASVSLLGGQLKLRWTLTPSLVDVLGLCPLRVCLRQWSSLEFALP